MGNILLAHESKTVRATLKAYLKQQHIVQETASAEEAWHMLVLDHEIDLVISGMDMEVSDSGMRLLTRLRQNALSRLGQMSFFFIGSETRIDEIREEAKITGANGFLHTGMKRQEVLDILAPFIGGGAEEAPSPADPATDLAIGPVIDPAASQLLAAASWTAADVANGETIRNGLRSRLVATTSVMSPKLFEEAVSRLIQPGQQGTVLCCGLRHYAMLSREVGEVHLKNILDRLTSLAQPRIGRNAIIGHVSPGVFAIATLKGTLAQCEAFAERLQKALAASRVVISGKPFSISLETVAATTQADKRLSGKDVLDRAMGELRNLMDMPAKAPPSRKNNVKESAPPPFPKVSEPAPPAVPRSELVFPKINWD